MLWSPHEKLSRNLIIGSQLIGLCRVGARVMLPLFVLFIWFVGVVFYSTKDDAHDEYHYDLDGDDLL